MKKTLYLLLALLGIAYSGYSIYSYSLDPCDRPVEYSIGRFDAQFGLSREEFKAEIKEAESVWERALNKNVFVYKEQAEFKINLIYDERQLATMQKQKIESGLAAAEDVLNGLDARFNAMKKEYDALASAHKEMVASFEKRQKEYQSQVDYWNARGGAPRAEYLALEKEASALKALVISINAEASILNAKTKELNALLDKRNNAAKEYNKVAESYNQKYGEGLEFNQAEYAKGEINVYEFISKADLTLALAHELGHALGMNHVENAKSIMYYITSGNTSGKRALSPTAEDLGELYRVCKIK